MISVEEARKLIGDHISPLKPVLKPLQDAAEHILSEDINAAFDIPAFRQSSMDGYAIIFDDVHEELNLIGEMAAGTTQKLTISKGQTSRIFTGAPLPEGADTVVMQEKTSRKDDRIMFDDEKLVRGANVRQIGSEIRIGELAMAKGNLLSP
ncbi:MAG: molybdopterin molybdenumtransferase MoeA, partial [Flavobacterium sp.]